MTDLEPSTVLLVKQKDGSLTIHDPNAGRCLGTLEEQKAEKPLTPCSWVCYTTWFFVVFAGTFTALKCWL
jgi:hypothetical protein